MPTRRTVLRNTGVAQQAIATGKSVKFRYTDQNGLVSKRVVTPTAADKTSKNPDALIVRAVEGLNSRSFRTDRMTHAVIV